jgi:hypothetical protein
MDGGINTLTIYYLYKESNNNSFQINLLLKPIKLRKLSKLFGDYPFKLDEDDKEE